MGFLTALVVVVVVVVVVLSFRSLCFIGLEKPLWVEVNQVCLYLYLVLRTLEVSSHFVK